jgi:O-acetyl-ADP-ribose deacetylase (regulator of RNase III)
MTEMKIRYVHADATIPQIEGNVVIAHVCNDLGRWGKGFVIALSQRWPEAEQAYRRWYRQGGDPSFALGEVQFVQVCPTLWVANMISQQGLYPRKGVPPIRYRAVHRCLAQVAAFAQEHSARVQMPRIGCGLAGGRWEEIEPLITETLGAAGIDVIVCDWP